MFDIGWSELLVIAVVALIAIGPKELPGVLRMVGQWMGKARKMASEFQGQFQEAMREAEMADLKKSFDEVREAASGLAGGNLMTSLQKDVSDALHVGDIDKPASATAAMPTIDRRLQSKRRRLQAKRRFNERGPDNGRSADPANPHRDRSACARPSPSTLRRRRPR